jgi:ketosteroid isomerase-like protein
MSQENVEIVRQAIAANRSGPQDATTDAAVALTDPKVEFVSRLTSVEGTYRGHDGLRRYFADMADAWREWQNEAQAIEELSPDTVLADVIFRAVGKSGVAAELRSAIVWELSDGKIARVHSYGSRKEALEAAGVSE